MTARAFAVGIVSGTTVVHDPLTGETCRAGRTLPRGRRVLDDLELAAWPPIHPASLSSDWPVSVCWSPLVRCNLACPHCLDDKTLPELGAAQRTTAAQAIADSEVLGVDISGGEPLLLTDLAELADRLTGGGCAVSVTTNGWHLPRRAAELAGRLDAIRVSLDGPTATLHDAVRGEGSFTRAIAGITASLTAGLPVQMQTVLRRSSAADSQQVVDLADRLGVHGVTFLQMLPIGEGAALPDEPLDDTAAQTLIDTLTVPAGITVRLRTRAAAEGFSVVRADGRIWHNAPAAVAITAGRHLRTPADLLLTSPDGSA